MRFCSKILDYIEQGVLVGCSAIMIVLNFFNVICRVLLPQTPFSYTEELTVILFVWTVMFGISYAYKYHAHTSLDLLVEKLPTNAKKIAIIFAMLCSVLLALTMIVTGYHMVATQIRFSQVTAGMKLPQALSGCAIPVGGVLIAFRSIEVGIQSLRDSVERSEQK